MAEEIKLSVKATLTNGFLEELFEIKSLLVDQAAALSHSEVATIGTTSEVVSFGDVISEGWCFMRNLDSTNFVSFGANFSGYLYILGKIKPGEFAAFRLEPGASLGLVADTAAVNVKIMVFED